ncbi:hypothetical protein [Pseudarthrobacter raffinosi]|uniref:hypothetical protein n=1 Tax=Pseudarthrobacter raffinosi TaxID=2953651 RepID=UPI00208F682B|nr:hypothetical protein [Pseudarthrobacter sp. MDT3-9]MCO4253120.1 hypothetical protein [Pseudarthrobacter sp. MDT3-9]
MTDLPPLLLARDRVLHGLTPNDLAKRVKAGSLVRVQAAAETFEKPTVFARQSAASVWGIPTIGLNYPVQALTMKNDGGRSRAGVRRHFAAPAGLMVVRREGLLVTGRIRTVLDLAAFTPFTEAAAPLDHVLRRDRTLRLPALTKAELESGIGSMYSAAAGRRVLTAVAFADPLSGSAGESYSRALIHVAGFEAPVLQQAIHDRDGLVGYTDFYWKLAKVVGESMARRSTSNRSSSRAGPRRKWWRKRSARTESGPRGSTW